MTGPGTPTNPSLFTITNADEAAAWYTEHYRDLRFRHVGDDFALRAQARIEPEFMFTRLAVDSTLRVTDVVERDEYIAFDITSGRYANDCGQNRTRIGAGDVFLFPQRGNPEIYVENVDHRVVTVTERHMDAVVREHRAEGKVRFTGNLPVGEEAVRRYLRVSQHLERVSMDEGALSPIAVGQMARYMAATILHTFPNDVLADLDEGTRIPGHRTKVMRQALEYINTNFLKDISVADIAEATRVTPRTLTNLFRLQFDMPPGEYLRRARLDWAHQELRAADPYHTKIHTISRRAGWANDSSFAKAYRAQFNVLPSHTLNRDP